MFTQSLKKLSVVDKQRTDTKLWDQWLVKHTNQACVQRVGICCCYQKLNVEFILSTDSCTIIIKGIA